MAPDPLPPALGEPVWFDRLREPTWLLPRAREGATRVAFVSQHADDRPDRDLLVGLPLYLAEAARFATEAATVALTAPVAAGIGDRPARELDASILVTTSTTGAGDLRRLRVRVERPAGTVLDDELAAEDGPALAEALADLPRRVTDALRATGVPGTWAPVYAPPTGAEAVRYVHAHRACLELGHEALYPPAGADPEIVSARRTIVRALLGALADFAQRGSGAFPALLYFGGLSGAHAHGSALPLEFRLQTNAICMEASDPRDIPFRLSALVLRLQGDQQIAERRTRTLEETGDRAVAEWLDRVEAVR
ncbi:MAG: hypothetical protein ACXWYI_01430 [Actinomycetota bacterium]